MSRRLRVVVFGLGMAVILSFAAYGYYTWRQPTDRELGGPFTLTADDGRTVSDKNYRGKWELIYFGYTYCPDACPTALNAVAFALDKLGPLAEHLQPLFITVDPGRDTPTVLHDYVANFDRRIVGLTGDAAAIAQVEDAFDVFARRVKTGDRPDDYLMAHSSLFYIMDPQGRFVTAFDTSVSASVLVDELRAFLSPSS